MQRLLATGILGVMLGLVPVPTGATDEGSTIGPSPTSETHRSQGPVPYDLPVLLEALAELTGWPILDWPLPQILQLPPEAFQRLTHLNRRTFTGAYDGETNQIFLNLHCRSQWPENPDAFCQATVFHELVHWGQHHSGIDKELNAAEEEQQALDYEIRYLAAKLGLRDPYPPDRPGPDSLPPLERPIRFSRSPRRIAIEDAVGLRHWVWVAGGTWLELRTTKRYVAEVIYHHAHWVGVQIFEVDPAAGRQLVESWWDAGYVPPETASGPGITFPSNPAYDGRWVRVR